MAQFLKYGWWVGYVAALWIWLDVAERMLFWQRAIGLMVLSGCFVLLEKKFKSQNNQ